MTTATSARSSRPRLSARRRPPRWSGRFAYVPWAAPVACYVGAAAAWLISVLVSATYPPAGEAVRVIQLEPFTVLTAVNLFAVVALVHDLWTLGRGPGSFRRTRAAGAVVLLINVLLLQYGLLLAYAPFDWLG